MIPKRNEKSTPESFRELSDDDRRSFEVFRNERELSDDDRRSSEVFRNKRELSDGDRRSSEGESKLREKYPMEIGGQRKEFQNKKN